MPLQKVGPSATSPKEPSLLSPIAYDDDAASIHSAGSGRSEQDTDSEDDELQMAARNSRELLARDRIVLLEDEELEHLVTNSLRTKPVRQQLHRRGSGLALPNPFKMFSSTSRVNTLAEGGSGSRATSPVPSGLSGEELALEKRRIRRERRERKRDRILDEAEHGETGELMYEMEEGGMKSGSETGSSSDRDDSDELDRINLLKHTSERERKGKSWWRWILVYSTIAVGFALIALIALKLSQEQSRHGISLEIVSNGTALFAPTTIIISLDGFRADFLTRGLTPRLAAFIKEGVSPLYMTPSFPSVTFPNHYTLATGLYPESHGVVGNTFWDPVLEQEFYYTDPDRSLDPKWWGGEPFWVTAERADIRTAIHMWPGSEAHILGIEPSFMDKYNGKESLSNKVARILEFLDKPGAEVQEAKVEEMRPQIIAAYVPNVDADGHKYGPNSTEIRTTIQEVDGMMDGIFNGLEERNLTGIVNVVVVSDHGMATTDMHRIIQLEDLVDLSQIEHIDGWPLVGLRPYNTSEVALRETYGDLKGKAEGQDNWDVFLRDVNMPERYHFSNNERIAPLWIVPKTGWVVVEREEYDVAEALKIEADGEPGDGQYHPRGLHGYDHEHPLMRAIFVARGPAFPHEPNSKVEHFQNINVYNILCDSVGLEPKPNNGTLRLPLKTVGQHSPDHDMGIETPNDPDTAVPATSGPDSADADNSSSIEEGVAGGGVAGQESAAQSSMSLNPTSPQDSDASASSSTPTGTTPPPPTSGDDGEGKEGGEKEGERKGVQETVQGWWDWIKGTVTEIWDSVTGGDKEDAGAGGDADVDAGGR